MITTYLAELRAAGRSDTTLRLRACQLADWARYCGDPLTAQRRDVVGWLSPPMAPSTRASKHAALRGLYDWARAYGLRPDSPIDGLPKVRVPDSGKRDIPDHVLGPVLAAATGQLRAALLLGRYAGLRAAEIARVNGGDSDGQRLWVVGKGGKRRAVPLSGVLVPVLEVDGWVFPGRAGGHVQAGTVTKWLSQALPAPYTGHSLRHAFATEWYAACGHDLLWTAQVLGHSSVETTRRYVHAERDGQAISQLIGTGLAGSAS